MSVFCSPLFTKENSCSRRIRFQNGLKNIIQLFTPIMMKRSRSSWIRLFCFFVLYAALLLRLDRHFFKKNSSFCIHFIQQSASLETLPPLSTEQEALLDSLLKEPFTYLSRGNSCYAFISQD